MQSVVTKKLSLSVDVLETEPAVTRSFIANRKVVAGPNKDGLKLDPAPVSSYSLMPSKHVHGFEASATARSVTHKGRVGVEMATAGDGIVFSRSMKHLSTLCAVDRVSFVIASVMELEIGFSCTAVMVFAVGTPMCFGKCYLFDVAEGVKGG